jgi:hypothetical protein
MREIICKYELFQSTSPRKKEHSSKKVMALIKNGYRGKWNKFALTNFQTHLFFN